MPKNNSEEKLRLKAKCIVDTLLQGNKSESARINGVSRRTVARYWEEFEEAGPDSAIAAYVAQEMGKKQDEIKKLDLIPTVIDEGIQFLRRSFVEADPRKPEVIREVSAAIAMLSETEMTRRVIDSRIESQKVYARSSGQN